MVAPALHPGRARGSVSPLILLHELVDYNLHIPANMVFFAVLAGIFFSDAETSRGHRTEGSRGTTRMDEPEPETTYTPVTPAKPAPDQIKNPFLDE